MEKFSIEIKEDQFLIKLERDGYSLTSLYKIISNLQTGFFNVDHERFTEIEDDEGDIRSRINDQDDNLIDYLEDK